MNAPERLTWDAFYHGRLLTQAEYRASLEILKAPNAINFGSMDDATHVAWCALFQSGVLKQRRSDLVVVLTEYGKVYARQRGIVVPS